MSILEGRVAVVTGAGQGIGLEVARLLSEHGAAVCVNDLDADLAQAAAAELGTAIAVVGDLTEPAMPSRLIEETVKEWGKLDIVVNNAGYSADGPVHKLTDDAFQRMLEIHTAVPFRVIRAAAPYLRDPAKKEREEGREVFRKIVNVSSTTGTMGNPGQANYAAGKAGVVGLTKTVAKEWGRFKVNVNAVAPSWIATRMLAPKDDANVIDVGGGKVQLGVPEEMLESAEIFVPMGRLGTPAEAAGAVFYLCTPWSDWVSGQVLTVSGGAMGGMTS